MKVRIFGLCNCGEYPHIVVEGEVPYSLKCKCGNATNNYDTISLIASEWSLINKGTTVNATYLKYCGCLDEVISNIWEKETNESNNGTR